MWSLTFAWHCMINCEVNVMQIPLMNLYSLEHLATTFPPLWLSMSLMNYPHPNNVPPPPLSQPISSTPSLQPMPSSQTEVIQTQKWLDTGECIHKAKWLSSNLPQTLTSPEELQHSHVSSHFGQHFTEKISIYIFYFVYFLSSIFLCIFLFPA